jgi:hypothetical protein
VQNVVGVIEERTMIQKPNYVAKNVKALEQRIRKLEDQLREMEASKIAAERAVEQLMSTLLSIREMASNALR